MVADPLRVALRVAEIFESLNIPYLVGGAVASAVLGEPRSTEDIDVVADIGSDQADSLISALGGEFYIPVDALRHAILHRSSCNVVHLETMRKVDIFVARHTGLDQEELTRRQRTFVARDPDRTLYIATPEDLILQKLDWYSSPWCKSSCIRLAMHPGWLRCSSFKYSRYSQSSRLASRAPRQPLCDAGLAPRTAGRDRSVSDRQWRDVLGLIKVQADRLDRQYMAGWASTIGVADLLERALQEAGSPE
jgi:hypothetical protein